MTTHTLMLLKLRASPDMLPFSLCIKKRLAIRHMKQTPLSNNTIDSVLWHREVGRAKDLSEPPRTRLHGVTRPRTINSSGLNMGKIWTLTHRYCFNCTLTAKNMGLLAYYNMQHLTEIWRYTWLGASYTPSCQYVLHYGSYGIQLCTHTVKWHPTTQTMTKFEWYNGCLDSPPVLGSHIYSVH